MGFSSVNEDDVTSEISNILRDSLRPDFTFHEVSEKDITKIVKSLKTNSCGVDNISTYFVKLSIDFSVYAITYIINNSFKHRKFPTQWKKALVKPIPKNDTLLVSLTIVL